MENLRMAGGKRSVSVINSGIKTTVAIIGAKGFANYGGYETFVDKLTQYHEDNPDIQYLVACKANGQGAMDESKLMDVHVINENEFVYHNAYCFKIKVPQIGPGQAILYDLLAAHYVIKYFRKNQIERPVLYVLTCRIGPFMHGISKKIHALGGYYYVNPDGHEWMRALWNKWIKRYWKYSERLMIKYADKVICDSKNIEAYIKDAYEKYHPDTTYIAYGTDLEKSKLQDSDDALIQWYDKWGLTPKNYYLVVGRFVPENNYEIMIREFMASGSKRDFAIVTNVNERFLDELEQKLHYKSDSRIKFVGTVYEQELLKKIREDAYAYFHGHEVGGTNPSLLEALGSTDLNLLLDVGFNREVGEDAVLYWSKDNGSLCSVITKADLMSSEEIAAFGKRAKKRIEDAYSWKFIADEYQHMIVGSNK